MANANLPPLAGVAAIDHVLEVCGFMTPANRASVRSEGFTEVEDFGMMKLLNFSSMVTRISKMRPAQGGFRVGEVHVQDLEALAYWVRDQQRRDEVIITRDFTQAVRNECCLKVDTEKSEMAQAKSSKPAAPTKFKVTNWVAWEIVFMNYLSGIYGVTGVPLSYIIRKEVPGHIYVTDTERLIGTAPMEGHTF